MIGLNIRIGKGSDWKTLRRNPIEQAIPQFPPHAKWTMNVSIFMLYCFLVRICHSAAWIRMFNLLLSFHFLQNCRICIWQGMKAVGMSGKICLLLWHFAYKIYLTMVIPLLSWNTKMQPPARSAEFAFHICRQIGHYDSHFHGGPKENQYYQKFRFKTLMWQSKNAFEIMKVWTLTSIHQCLQSSNLSCAYTIHLQHLTETSMRLN